MARGQGRPPACGKPLKPVYCRDNKLYLVNACFIASVHATTALTEFLETPSARSPQEALQHIKRSLMDAAVVRWNGSDLGMASPGSTATAKIAYNLTRFIPDTREMLLDGTGWPETVAQAKRELKGAKRELRVLERDVRRAKQRLRAGARGRSEGRPAWSGATWCPLWRCSRRLGL
jgi:hypothetical protein